MLAGGSHPALPDTGRAPDGKASEAGITMATVTHLLVPGWAEDLDRYTAVMTSNLP